MSFSHVFNGNKGGTLYNIIFEGYYAQNMTGIVFKLAKCNEKLLISPQSDYFEQNQCRRIAENDKMTHKWTFVVSRWGRGIRETHVDYYSVKSVTETRKKQRILIY